MTSTVVKELLVKFDGDTKGLDVASSKARMALSGVANVVKATAATSAILGTAFLALAAKQAQLGDELGKTSDRLGIATEKLAGYYHAASLAGVSNDTFNNSIKFMFKNAVDAAGGNAELGAAFNALGVNVSDFMSLKPDAQFELIAQKISEIENPAVRSAMAMKIFGKSGTDMLDLIKDGTGSLTTAADEAERFGLVISRIDSAQLEAANDAVSKIGDAAGGAARQFAVGLSPAITTVIENMLGGVDSAESFRQVGEEIGETFVATFDAIKTAIDEVNKQFLEFSEGYYRLQGEMADAVPDRLQETLGLDPEKAKVAADKIMEEIIALDNKIQARNNQGGDSLLKKYYDQKNIKVPTNDNKGMSSKDAAMLGALDTKAATEALKKHEEAAKKAQEAQMEYNNKVADSFIDMKDQMISGGNALDNFKKLALNAVNEILNNIIRMSVGGESGGGLFGSIASSLIGSLTGGLGGMFSSGLSGAAAGNQGLGLALQGFAGFAKGGSFEVGGDGATDSGLVAFKATRGEQVTVSKPNQTSGGGASYNVTQNITIGTSVSASVRQEVAKMLPEIKRATVSGVEDARLRGATN